VKPKLLRRANSGKLNAAGTVQLELSPSGEDWLIRTTRITCVQPLPTSPEPELITYRSSVSPANQIDSSSSGFSATSGQRILLTAGESLIAVWTGGPADALATLIVEGISYPSGQGIAAYAGGT